MVPFRGLHQSILSIDSRSKIWFEPTDIHKAAKPFESEKWRTIEFLSPNLNELKIMCRAAGMEDSPSLAIEISDEEVVQEAKRMVLFLATHVGTVIATLSHRGVVIGRRGDADDPFFTLDSKGCSKRKLGGKARQPAARYYAAPVCQPTSVSGAGDCWNAGFISAAIRGESERVCVEAGFQAALCSLAVSSAVPTDMKIGLSEKRRREHRN